jgi:copper homeostasis protein
VTALEIAVTSAEGARTACRSGADRIELAAALELGGLTPSAGLLEATLVGLDPLTSGTWQGVHVLIRPRPGDFVYDEDDVSTAVREVRAVCRGGAQGVVVGALTPDGSVDAEAVRRLAGAAKEADPASTVTFHRAVDQTPSVMKAFAGLLELGAVDRVLTSGGKAGAGQAIAELTALVGLAARRVQVMAGGGVTLDDLPALVAAGVDAVHLSAKRRVAGAGARVALGAGDADLGAYFVTDGDVVAAAAARLTPRS